MSMMDPDDRERREKEAKELIKKFNDAQQKAAITAKQAVVGPPPPTAPKAPHEMRTIEDFNNSGSGYENNEALLGAMVGRTIKAAFKRGNQTFLVIEGTDSAYQHDGSFRHVSSRSVMTIVDGVRKELQKTIREFKRMIAGVVFDEED